MRLPPLPPQRYTHFQEQSLHGQTSIAAGCAMPIHIPAHYWRDLQRGPLPPGLQKKRQYRFGNVSPGQFSKMSCIATVPANKTPMPPEKEAALSDCVNDSAFHDLAGRFASLRCRVRRCIPSRRAVSEIFPWHSISIFWICSHSRRATDRGRVSTAVSVSPLSR